VLRRTDPALTLVTTAVLDWIERAARELQDAIGAPLLVLS
jgi:hypothetical protein